MGTSTLAEAVATMAVGASAPPAENHAPPRQVASTHTMRLAGPTDLDGFRRACRALVAAQVRPEDVSWFVADAADADLFDVDVEADAGSGSDSATETFAQAASAETRAAADVAARSTTASPALAESPPEAVPIDSPTPGAPALRAPAAFVALCETVVLHRDPARFGLLYRLLWRLLHESGLRHDPLDADRVQAHHLAQAVRRDKHKMTAFVRFRRIDPAEPGAEPVHVAWFEPEHHIVEATAPFFARRFAQMRWAILTPERCVRWDGHELEFGPGAQRDAAPPVDAGERLWLTYYESIFNPARLKLAMMQKEMPRRYWKNLPEAVLIAPLAAEAAERSGRMVEQAATTPARRLPTAAMPARIKIPVRSADSPAATSADLPALGAAIDRCRDCPIGALATQGVPGEGPLGARLMFVGEQPGDQEDLRGRPFVGPAGQLFDRALAQLGWPRDAVYVANAVKHFKFELRGKRRIHKTPAQQEAAACLQWLEREIELVAPKAIVALGATAARSLLGTAVPVMRERGRWLTRADGRRVLVTLHPSALLRADPSEREAGFTRWLEDFAAAADLMRATDDQG